MSQASKLPSIKKIELSIRQLRPPLNLDGSNPRLVGAMDNGTPIYEGDIFLGNSKFADLAENGKSLSAHDRVPVQGPDGDVWRLNKATGQKIIRAERGKRRYGKRKFIMADFGNGNGGPIPVPTADPKQEIEDELETLKAVLKEEGLTFKSFISMLKGNAQAAGEEPVNLDVVEDEFPKGDERGPWFTLSNGERVKGKEAAVEAETALHPPPGD